MSYVKEEAEWKFLKFAYRPTYMTPCKKGWIEESQGASIAATHDKFPSDKPCTYHLPYSPHRINVFQPEPLSPLTTEKG